MRNFNFLSKFPIRALTRLCFCLDSFFEEILENHKKGFYVNNCDFAKFDPRPADVPYLSHSLADLMSQLSPRFKKNWSTINKKRCALHPFERLPTNYQLFSWLSPREEHQVRVDFSAQNLKLSWFGIMPQRFFENN